MPEKNLITSASALGLDDLQGAAYVTAMVQTLIKFEADNPLIRTDWFLPLKLEWYPAVWAVKVECGVSGYDSEDPHSHVLYRRKRRVLYKTKR